MSAIILNKFEQAIRCTKVYQRMSKMNLMSGAISADNFNDIDNTDTLFQQVLCTTLDITRFERRSNVHYIWKILEKDIHKLYVVHYDVFCHLEKLLFPKKAENDALNVKIADLEKTISDLETKIIYMPNGSGYEKAKHNFETLQKCHINQLYLNTLHTNGINPHVINVALLLHHFVQQFVSLFSSYLAPF